MTTPNSRRENLSGVMKRAFVIPLLLAGCHGLDTFETATGAYPGSTPEAFPGGRVDFTGEVEVRMPDDGLYGVPFQAIEGYAVTGGDILLGSADEMNLRSASSTLEFHVWPSCTVPYSFHEDLSVAATQKFLTASDQWHQETGIHFVEAPGASARVSIRPSDGCSSALGRTGMVQTMALSPACTVGNIMHEIGHAVGLFHEQNRSDSEDFVIKNFDVIPEDIAHNFRNYEERELPGMDHGAYDFTSIMHYPSWAGSTGHCAPSRPEGCSLLHMDGSYILEHQHERLSEGDIASVASMYDCEGVEPLTYPPADDHGNDFEGSSGIEVSGQYAEIGELSYDDDVDMFRLYVSVAGAFTVSTTGDTDTFGTLYDSEGVELDSDDDGGEGLNFSLVRNAEVEEIFYVGVRGYNSTTLGTYTLHLDAAEPTPDPEPPPVIDVPGAIDVQLSAVFGSASQSMSADLVAGQMITYRVNIESIGPVAFSAAITGDTDAFGTLRNGSGALVASNEDTPGENIAGPLEPGVYFFDVQGYESSTAGPFSVDFVAAL